MGKENHAACKKGRKEVYNGKQNLDIGYIKADA